jgi:pyruvate dehydrogenase E2 component (dihydrolipoamide acetyltransferase)
MASEIRLPELGENVEGGTIVSIAVKAGEQVSEGQTLMEVEAGKSTVPVPSPMSGKITEILVKQGDEVETNQVLLKVEGQASGAAKPQEAAKPAAKPEQSKSAPAQARAKGEPAKAASNGPATAPAKADDPAQETSRENVTAASAALREDPGTRAPSTQRPGHLIPASPATRLLARELGVNLADVTGSGRNGRVTQEDIKTFVRQLASGQGGRAVAVGAGVQAPPLPDFRKWGETENKPLDNVRRETARHMALCWSLIPHVTQHDLADITDLDAFRRSQPKDGPRITVTAFALKAVAIALQQFPQFNASLDLSKNQLVLKKYYHLGLAVDTDRGLLVPVLRDVDKKSVHQLAAEMAAIAEKARQGKISMSDMQGGTFTITNLGGIGGTAFTPIVNWPEVAILGMSRARQEPVWRDGAFVPRLMLPLSLSYDHRVIDGADAARFTRRVAEMLENPLVMLLHA